MHAAAGKHCKSKEDVLAILKENKVQSDSALSKAKLLTRLTVVLLENDYQPEWFTTA